MKIEVGVLRELAQERNVNFDKIAEAVEQALLAAYTKLDEPFKNVRVDFNRKNGEIKIFGQKILSQELVEEASATSEAKYSYELEDDAEITPEHFGRRATSIAKQVVQQELNREEDALALGDLKNKKNQLISGMIKANLEEDRFAPRGFNGPQNGGAPASARGVIKVDLGDGKEASLPLHEQVIGEDYSPGMRYRFYVLDVVRTPRGPQITVSRSHPDLVRRLFETEVPELKDGLVETVSVSREAGHRTKIAIKSNDKGVSAKGAFIGPSGARARAVMNELGGEKIDIIEWSEDPATYVGNSLSPSKTVSVNIIDERGKVAQVIVPDYQLSLAIGKDGQNSRLAARLTGWKIDIFSDGKTKAPEEN
jgi:N utilization substance protein A